VNTQSTAYNIIAVSLRIALLLALGGAVWSIYQRLPDDEMSATNGTNGASATTLLIVLRTSTEDAGAALDIPVELYPVDVAAVRREYQSEMRAGMRFRA
jgi:hypothetical protein